MTVRLLTALAVLACGFGVPAWGQDAETPPVAAAPAAEVVPKGTVVPITVTQEISSATAVRGDMFTIELAAPLMLGDKVVLPAGTPGMGQVVHAKSKDTGGTPGEILIAARYLEFEGKRIPLKGFQLSAGGRDTGAASLWALGLVKGSETTIPKGAGGPAKLAEDLTVDPVQP